MISKRSRRSTGPQENLKQFSLNNSKGVDETKAIIDPNTVSYMKNLTVNLDGSLSLRKPMKAHKTISGLTTDNIFLMFTEKHYLVFSGESGGVGFSIVNENGNSCNLVYEVQDYYTNELTTFTDTKGMDLFDTSAASCINTADSTVIGNSYIYAQTFSDTSALSVVGKKGFTVVDASLYDTFNENSKLPRYLQITQSEDSEDTFKVAVKTPEINTLTTAEGEPSLNPNMTLDNPYAIRDVYGSVLPSVSGILQYTSEKSFTTLTKISGDYEKVSLTSETGVEKAYFKKEPKPFIPTLNDETLANIIFEIKDASDMCLTPTITIRNATDYVVSINLDCVMKHSYTTTSDPNGTPNYASLTESYSRYGTVVDAWTSDSVVLKDSKFYILPNLEKSFTYTPSFKNTTSFKDFKGVFQTNGKIYYNDGESGSYVDVKYLALFMYVRDFDDKNFLEGYCVLQDGRIFSSNISNSNLESSTAGVFDLTWYETSESGGGVNSGPCVRFSIRVSDKVYFRAYNSDTYYILQPYLDRSTKILQFMNFPYRQDRFGSTTLMQIYNRTMYIDLLEFVKYSVQESLSIGPIFTTSTLSEMFETSKYFKPVTSTSLSNDVLKTVVKAFGRYSKSNSYYATWEYSVDGVVWNPYGPVNLSMYGDIIYVKEPNERYVLPNTENIPDEDELGHSRYLEVPYVMLNSGTSSNTLVVDVARGVSRVDVFPMALLYNVLHNVGLNFDETTVTLKFNIITVKTVDSVLYRDVLIASQVWKPSASASTEYLETNLPNAVLGEKYHYKKAIYSYGDEYDGIVHVSNPGSFITPLYNVLEIGTSANSIPNSIVPWRDYLITFTENDVSLSSKKDTGFYTKTISTSVGVPFSDRKCPKAALNGIIFKSGRFVYFAYPNLYSGDDTALTLTNISRPIQSVLDSLTPDVECFAEVVDDMYLLMVPDPEEYCTLCLRYSLTDKHWEIYEYPVRFLKFLKSDYAGAVMYGVFKNNGVNAHGVFSISESGDAYDVFTVNNEEAPVSTQPIAFMLDTGQKTDSISNTKQFVESKLVFATLDDGDTFPFTTHVAIDGDPHVHTMDVSTDAPFWKPIDPNPDNPVLGVLGTSFGLGGEVTPASGKFNTLRQLVIRYSGKGKSIRHVIEGESQCNFKLYETYVRYKNLNGK